MAGQVRRDRRPFFRAQFTVDLGVLKDILYILYDTVSDCIIRIRSHTCLYETIRSEQVLETPIAGRLASSWRASYKFDWQVLDQDFRKVASCITHWSTAKLKSSCNHKVPSVSNTEKLPGCWRNPTRSRKHHHWIIRSVEKVVSKLQSRLSSYCRYLTEGLPWLRQWSVLLWGKQTPWEYHWTESRRDPI